MTRFAGIREIKIGDGIGKTNASHQKTILDNPLGVRYEIISTSRYWADCFHASDATTRIARSGVFKIVGMDAREFPQFPKVLSDSLSSCRQLARTRLRKRVFISASGSQNNSYHLNPQRRSL